MKTYVYCLLAALLGGAAAWGQPLPTPRGEPDATEGFEVLTRGPVHEAFAATVAFNPEPGVVAPKAPPEAIEELPPDQRPEGDHVAWIPGYWAWDDERDDFLWISGVWRNLPPGRQWVPGYWAQATRGAQWTSGYWADLATTEVEYLSEPPESVEAGPNVAATSPDQIWLPGCWVWQENRYAWRPGYWTTGHENWVWTPAYYSWTPRGYVFVDGYYDYSVARRGLLFAPVYFNSRRDLQPRHSYSPSAVINLGVFASQLFLRPNYHHYYYGDYYAASYTTAGYYPSHSYNSRHHGYDPFYAQQRWQHRDDRTWERTVHANFLNLRDNEQARPPRTWAAQQAQFARPTGRMTTVATLAQLAKSDNPLRLQALNAQERQKLVQHASEVHGFRQQREKMEARAAAGERTAEAFESKRIRLPPSPLAARPTGAAGQAVLGPGQTPPKRHVVLKPDLQVQPKPRIRNAEPAPGTRETRPPLGKPDLSPRIPSPRDLSPRDLSPRDPSPRYPSPRDPSPRDPSPRSTTPAPAVKPQQPRPGQPAPPRPEGVAPGKQPPGATSPGPGSGRPEGKGGQGKGGQGQGKQGEGGKQGNDGKGKGN